MLHAKSEPSPSCSHIKSLIPTSHNYKHVHFKIFMNIKTLKCILSYIYFQIKQMILSYFKSFQLKKHNLQKKSSLGNFLKNSIVLKNSIFL